MKHYRKFAAFAAVLLATAAWAQPAPATAPAKTAEMPVPKECREMAEQFAVVANTRDTAGFNRIVSTRRLAEHSTEGVTAPPTFKKAFEDGASAKGLAAGIIPAFEQQKVEYHLLRIGWQDGEIVARYRMLGTGGVNYHEWTCERQLDGSWRFVDGYFASTGEKCSETFRRLYKQALATQNPGVIGKIRGVDKQFLDDIKTMSELSVAIRGGKAEEALRLYGTLSPEFAKSKLAMIFWITSLKEIRATRPGQFKEACAEYQKQFPGDPSIDLICLDSFLSDKNFAACYASLDRLQNRFQDTYLKTVRASVLMRDQKAGNLEQAETLLVEMIETEPSIFSTWDALIQVRTKLKKNAQAVEALKGYERVAHQPLGPAMEAMPEYADFVATDEYKVYKAATYK